MKYSNKHLFWFAFVTSVLFYIALSLLPIIDVLIANEPLVTLTSNISENGYDDCTRLDVHITSSKLELIESLKSSRSKFRWEEIDTPDADQLYLSNDSPIKILTPPVFLTSNPFNLLKETRYSLLSHFKAMEGEKMPKTIRLVHRWATIKIESGLFSHHVLEFYRNQSKVAWWTGDVHRHYAYDIFQSHWQGFSWNQANTDQLFYFQWDLNSLLNTSACWYGNSELSGTARWVHLISYFPNLTWRGLVLVKDASNFSKAWDGQGESSLRPADVMKSTSWEDKYLNIKQDQLSDEFVWGTIVPVFVLFIFSFTLVIWLTT